MKYWILLEVYDLVDSTFHENDHRRSCKMRYYFIVFKSFFCKSIITFHFTNLDSWGAMRKEGTRNCNEEQNIDYLFKQDR